MSNNPKFPGLVDILKKCGIIDCDSSAEVTIKLNQGGILWIRVKNEVIHK